jgi:hypothetical protein
MTSRLAQLSGTDLHGTLQIADHAINEIIALLRSDTSRHLTLEVCPHNIVIVRYGVLHARAELPDAMAPGPTPRITVHLLSWLVAMALKVTVRQPFLHVHGKHLTIELAAIPAPHAWRDLWRSVRRLTFETVSGAVRVGFVVEVKGEMGLHGDEHA